MVDLVFEVKFSALIVCGAGCKRHRHSVRHTAVKMYVEDDWGWGCMSWHLHKSSELTLAFFSSGLARLQKMRHL